MEIQDCERVLEGPANEQVEKEKGRRLLILRTAGALTGSRRLPPREVVIISDAIQH